MMWNQDRYNPEYRELNDVELKHIKAIKNCASSLAELLNEYVPYDRPQMLALTKLDECVMWATKGITK